MLIRSAEERDFVFNLLVTLALAFSVATNPYFISPSIGVYLLPYPFLLLFVVTYCDWRAVLRYVEPIDWLAVGFVAVTTFAVIVHPNRKSTTYIALYSYSAIFMAVLLRNAIGLWGARRFLQDMNLLGVMMISALAGFEFCWRSLAGRSPISFLPLANPPLSICGYSIPRVYAFSVEPTYLAWYFTTLGTLAIWHLWRMPYFTQSTKYTASAIFVFANIVTWSISGLACLVIAGGAILFYMAIFDRSTLASYLSFSPEIIKRGAVVAVFAITPLLGLAKDMPSCLDYAGLKVFRTFSDITAQQRLAEMEAHLAQTRVELTKATPTGKTAIYAVQESLLNSIEQLDTTNPKAGMSRFQIWKHDLSLAFQKPLLGWGPGYNSSIGSDSSLNIFLFIFMEQGIIAAALFLMFMLSIAWRMLRSGSPSRYVYLLAYGAGSLHLLTQTKHFHAHLWLVVGLFWMDYVKQIRSQIEQRQDSSQHQHLHPISSSEYQR